MLTKKDLRIAVSVLAKGKKNNVIFDKMMEVSKLQLKMEIAMNKHQLFFKSF